MVLNMRLSKQARLYCAGHHRPRVNSALAAIIALPERVQRKTLVIATKRLHVEDTGAKRSYTGRCKPAGFYQKQLITEEIE
jgi:hypothetical protein